MVQKPDEEVLVTCYAMLASEAQKKAKACHKESDKDLANGIFQSCTKLLISLDTNIPIPMADIQKNITKAKGTFNQFIVLRARNPQCITSSFENSMWKLVRVISIYEAEMLEMLRLQEASKGQIDVEGILSSAQGLNKLKSKLAKDIVKEELKLVSWVSLVDKSVNKGHSDYYATIGGKKYHVADCRYCKGHSRELISSDTIKIRGLEACSCIVDRKESTGDCVTVFIDESIKELRYTGKVGNFSYFICKGNLLSEDEICSENTLLKGIDYVYEHKSTMQIAESAIGKVLVILAYDFNYDGPVKIYTDNKSAADKWITDYKNSRLEKLFLGVNVSYIPREKNKKADSLLRARVIMNISMDEYDDVLRKCSAYESWKTQRDNIKREVVEELANQYSIDLTNPKSQPSGQKKIMGIVLSFIDSVMEKFKSPQLMKEA